MFNTILQTLQLRANMLYMRAKQWEKWNPQEQDSKNKNISIHSIAYFKECWEASGLAKITGTHSLPVLLRVRGH